MALSENTLRDHGIYTFDTLGETLGDEVEYVIDGLLIEGSVNLLAGDSGIGKTPLCLQMALAIAAGVPFMGHKVSRPRSVLYCDAESNRRGFHSVVQTLAKFMGLKEVPKNFHVWSPNWDQNMAGIDFAGSLFLNAQLEGFTPEVIFVDPLRVFFPEADLKREKALMTLKRMRQIGSTWMITHHIRKPSLDHPPRHVDEEPHAWFNEVAGQHALINHVDTRLGVELTPDREGSEMTLGGFVRMQGPINPVYLARDYNDDGEPRGYVRASSLDLLNNPQYETAYHQLPTNEIFTFKVARDTLGKSDSSTANFLKRLQSIGVVTKIEGQGYRRI